jgi:hypothetical protein
MKRSFLRYFHDEVIPIKLVDKRDSKFMQLIAFLLTIGKALRIVDIDGETFMKSYGTTIGKTIYDNPGWRWELAPNTYVCHELCHTVQFSFLMALRYVFSTRWRMFYESECVQCELLCFPGKRHASWMEIRVTQFRKYGIKEHIVRQELNKRLEEIARAEPRASAARVFDAYTFWKVESANH